jgi:LamB porin
MSRRMAVAGVLIVGLVRAVVAHAQPEPSPPAPADDEPAPQTPGEPVPPPAPATTDVAPAAPAPASAPAPLPDTIKGPEIVKTIDSPPTGFTFGSYGRLIVGTDLRGGSPEPIKVIAHPPRIVEPTYLELQFGYGFQTPRGDYLRTITTLAFGDKLFHYTGEFDAQPAIRNLYAEALLGGGVSLWAGSRMYRGDDIYLFDYWPLDDLNTVGGGAQLERGRVTWAGHAGVNRLLNDFQHQTRTVPDPEQGATVVTQLDRQRIVGSTSVTVRLPDVLDVFHAKLKLYGELQGLPSGTRLRMDDTAEHLPADWGTTLGAQVGAWNDRGDHLNLFARWSRGLSAFDELAPPTELSTSLQTFPGASELVFGASAAWSRDRANLMLGAQSRRFVGAGPRGDNPDDGWEYAVDARPLARVVDDFYAGADVSFQARFPRGLNPTSQLAEDPGVFQIAPMIVYSPMGPSAYARPQLRLVYRAAYQNQGALDLYVPDDPRHAHPWVHFLGVQAEWWFNSSYR